MRHVILLLALAAGAAGCGPEMCATDDDCSTVCAGDVLHRSDFGLRARRCSDCGLAVELEGAATHEVCDPGQTMLCTEGGEPPVWDGFELTNGSKFAGCGPNGATCTSDDSLVPGCWCMPGEDFGVCGE